MVEKIFVRKHTLKQKIRLEKPTFWKNPHFGKKYIFGVAYILERFLFGVNHIIK